MTHTTTFQFRLIKTFVPLFVIAAFLPMQSAVADENDFAKLINRGNASLAGGEFDEAMEDYQQAATIRSNSNELQYNEAIALYRQGDTAQSRQLFAEATSTRNRELEAKARFNLANCDYTDALGLAEQDREAAIEKAKSAISHYRGALAAEPHDSDARANIELANLLIKQLQQEQQQQQEQQEQDQQQQQQQQQDSQDENQQDNQQQRPQDDQQEQDENEDKSQQQSLNSETDSNSQDEESNGQSEHEDQQEPGEHGKDSEDDTNSDNNQGTDEKSGSENQQSEGSDQGGESNQKNEEQLDRTEQDQQSPGQSESHPQDRPDEQEEQGRSSETEETERQETDRRQQQSGTVGPASEESQEGNQQGTSTVAADYGQEEGQAMTEQEALKMLQAVRDRDLLRRMQNLKKAQSRYVPVDKDW